jgi:hypothetical protein
MGWYYWVTLNWMHDPGGARLLSGELLLVAAGCVLLFAFLTWPFHPYPLLGYVLGPSGLLLGALLAGWGLWAHREAGLAWWDWDWEGEGRPSTAAGDSR